MLLPLIFTHGTQHPHMNACIYTSLKANPLQRDKIYPPEHHPTVKKIKETSTEINQINCWTLWYHRVASYG